MLISIAMATYNGNRYLREQLDSLATQKFLPSELVVCDDGSTDDTLQILADFATAAPFPVKVHRNEKNLGYALNFLKAARLCKGEWISFCDQDDVWLPNKLDDARVAIENDSRPVLILQNSYICDAHLSHSNRLFPDRLRVGYHPPQSQYGFWVWLGFLQTFHKSLLEQLLERPLPHNYFPGHEFMSHDKWSCMIANAKGGVYVLGGACALYRRHDQALTGAYAGQSPGKRVGKAVSVGGDHYTFLSEVADETADYLLAAAESTPTDVARALVVASQGYNRIAEIQTARAGLYKADSLFIRVRGFTNILKLGGYVGPPMVALGWKSLAKDVFRVVGMIGAKNRGEL